MSLFKRNAIERELRAEDRRAEQEYQAGRAEVRRQAVLADQRRRAELIPQIEEAIRQRFQEQNDKKWQGVRSIRRGWPRRPIHAVALNTKFPDSWDENDYAVQLATNGHMYAWVRSSYKKVRLRSLETSRLEALYKCEVLRASSLSRERLP